MYKYNSTVVSHSTMWKPTLTLIQNVIKNHSQLHSIWFQQVDAANCNSEQMLRKYSVQLKATTDRPSPGRATARQWSRGRSRCRSAAGRASPVSHQSPFQPCDHQSEPSWGSCRPLRTSPDPSPSEPHCVILSSINQLKKYDNAICISKLSLTKKLVQ